MLAIAATTRIKLKYVRFHFRGCVSRNGNCGSPY